jgi:riboflavin kinase/FMN adenylyltransferase
MKVLSHPNELAERGRRVCLAIGMFDGVHLGHQEVIRRMVADAGQQHALAAAVTFDRHPNTVVAPECAPPLIHSLPQKLRAIAALGVEAAWLIPFDRAFSQLSGEAFIRGLANDFGPLGSVWVGEDFAFGRQRSGNLALLQALGLALGFQVHALPAVTLDGAPVSSTRIRDAIQAGDLQLAARMLGRTYTLAGQVVAGDGVGQTLGYPTANLEVSGLALPPTGVYASWAATERRQWPAVVNIGRRPTVAESQGEIRIEAHLLGCGADLYGQQMELAFAKRLRPEIKFDSLAALREQITRDVAAAREFLSAPPSPGTMS